MPANQLRARPPPAPLSPPPGAPDWERERLADEQLDVPPLAVDRGILRKVVEREMGRGVEGVEFLGSGTFHKCYLVTLKDHPPVVARIAQPYFPTLKTASEVATLDFLRHQTTIPVPLLHAHNPTTDNGLRAEYTLESLAPGVKLSSIPFSSIPPAKRIELVQNLARMLVPVLKYRFDAIGSLYFSDSDSASSSSSEAGAEGASGSCNKAWKSKYKVGPIVSWPFFGNGRGFRELDRGPWKSEREYLDACVKREIEDIRREAELARQAASSSSASASSSSPAHEDDDSLPDPDVDARSGGGSESTDSDNSEGEDDDGYGSDYNPHELMYKAYRQQQSLLVTPFRRFSASSSHSASGSGARGAPGVGGAGQPPERVKSRLEMCEEEMERFMRQMEAFGIGLEDSEGFALDLHDIRADNIFVDPADPSTITCIIDFESTTLRPLSQASHLPALLLPPPQGLPSFQPPNSKTTVIGAPQTPSPWAIPELQDAFRRAAGEVDGEWTRREREGKGKRVVHRLVEWDGWEPGMVDHVLGALRRI